MQLARINACLAEITEVMWNSDDPGAELVVLGCVLAPVRKDKRSR